ncbi:S9 family peptidase (plasmid) [Halorussus salilacus]|uniref:S9 family peptidase n=1 Tax=Halorussus salilacus TaxID=2953750 RepID=UPI00209C9034|nr:S9 family peptidase [Halorussus salilacus]USZ69965.1 S9 family peptidase [Halorussus salilacus]
MPDPLEVEDFYDLTLLTDLAVSPDGGRVAFVAAEFDRAEDDRRSSVFVAPTDGSRDPHRLSRASDASAPVWSPDGSKLGFLAARETDAEIAVSRDEDADESEDADENGGSDDEPKTQVWAFDLERGGDARQLTDFEEGARSFDWGPEGDRLVVAARDPTDDQREYLERRRDEDGPIEIERLQHKYDGKGWLDDVTTYLFVVDCDTREAERLDDAYGGGAREPALGLQPAWSPAGDDIAFLSNRTDRPDDNHVMDVYLISPDGSACRKVTDSDLTASRLRWHPEGVSGSDATGGSSDASDGERLAFVGGDPENWYVPSEVFVADLDSGATVRSRSADLDRTVARYGSLGWRGDDVLAAVGDEGLTRLVRFPADGEPKRIFHAQGRGRTIEGFDCRGGTAAVVLSDPQEGTDVYAVDAAGLDAASPATADRGVADGDAAVEPTRISAVNEDLLADAELPECRRLTVESDGQEIEALAYLPTDFDPEDPDPRPLVASIHGGPISYDAPTFSFEYAHFTGRGYVVLRTNYRGSSSYGREFSEQIRGEWGPRERDDVLAGVEELVERGWADPDRCFATGFSYGGITTGYLITASDRFAAAAAEHGLYDFRSAFGTDDSHVWWEDDFGLPWEDPEGYDASSSILDVGEVETPLLVTAGGEDWRCPPSQSEQLYVSVKKQGVPARLVVYPDEHHNIGDPDRAVHRLEELTDWFARHDPAVESS